MWHLAHIPNQFRIISIAVNVSKWVIKAHWQKLEESFYGKEEKKWMGLLFSVLGKSGVPNLSWRYWHSLFTDHELGLTNVMVGDRKSPSSDQPWAGLKFQFTLKPKPCSVFQLPYKLAIELILSSGWIDDYMGVLFLFYLQQWSLSGLLCLAEVYVYVSVY